MKSPTQSKPRRVRTPTMFQMEATECGAASLGMVLGYHGLHKPLEELRVACGVSRNGSVASLILRAAESYGLKSAGYKLPAEKLALIPIPAIAHWDFSHFVVLEGKKGKYFYLNDPASGPVRYTEEEFAKHYTGIVLAFERGDAFKPGGRRLGVLATMLPLLGRVREAVLAMLWVGLLLVLPGLLVPAMLQIFIDEVLDGKSYWLAPLLVAFALTAAARGLLVWLQQTAMRRGMITLMADSTIRTLVHMFNLPINFFMQRNPAALKYGVELNDQVAGAVFGLLAVNVVNCLISLFFLALMCSYSLVLSGISLLTAIVNFAILRAVNQRRQILAQELQVESAKQMTLTLNGVSMMENLRASGREGFFFQRMGQFSVCLYGQEAGDAVFLDPVWRSS